MTVRIVTIGLLCLFASSPVVAQDVTQVGRAVTGVVIDSVSHRPLQLAVLYFDGRTGEFRSGRDGRFRIEGAGPRDTVMVVRQIGYVPARVAVPFSRSAAEVDVGSVALRPVATKLDVIVVEAEEVRRFPQLQDFYRRKNLGLAGFFMTPEDIARASARKTSSLLERTVKVRTQCNENGGQWQKGAPFDCTAKNSRPQGTSGGEVVQCDMEVWVDGARSSMQVDEIPVREIVALEVYSGPATTPAAFGSGHCGVVVIWTTHGTTR